ncbi:MAG: rod shape-determining protein RodA [Desulfuromonadia bacterium]
MIDRRLLENIDWKFILLVLVIVGIGVTNIQSASLSYRGGGGGYALKQLVWLAAGVIVLLSICTVDYHLFEDLSYGLYALVIVLLLAVLLVGKTSMGATRWLSFGFFNLQPSELMKPVIVTVLARYFAVRSFPGLLGFRELTPPFLIVLFPVILIARQPDLGTAIMVILVAGSMVAGVGIRPATVATLTLGSIPLLFLGWRYGLKDYQKKRILNFVDPEHDPLGSGYHIIQSKIAIGSGGFFGKGYMEGTQSRLRFLPEQHTDFAFSVFGEEWGFAGCFILILLYALLILWGLQIARECSDRFGALMAVGCTAILFWHTVINIGMVIGLFPVVGVPLPFFSYGGTSMITSMGSVGILVSIRMRRFIF